MINKWTALFVKLNGEMKRVGNVNLLRRSSANPSTGAINFYLEGYKYSDSPDLYYVNELGLYEQYAN
jgi:hypothetical protein